MDIKAIVKKYDLTIRGVLHIGAYNGAESVIYADMGIVNALYFEPVNESYDLLVKKVGEERAIHTALGNYTGFAEMNIASNGQSSTILEPTFHTLQYPYILFQEKQKVPMARLDDIEFRREDYNFISIDVEGYEIEVFKGGLRTLESIDCINCEVSRQELRRGSPLVEEVDEFLSKFGFKRVETDWFGVNWGDAFYVR